jgi:hypothetical protein
MFGGFELRTTHGQRRRRCHGVRGNRVERCCRATPLYRGGVPSLKCGIEEGVGVRYPTTVARTTRAAGKVDAMPPKSPKTTTWNRLAPVGLLLGIVACDSGPSISEALATQEEDKFEYEPNTKPRPKDLAPPTEAEFKAWNRKDPEGEKHLYKWDKDNLSKMLVSERR